MEDNEVGGAQRPNPASVQLGFLFRSHSSLYSHQTNGQLSPKCISCIWFCILQHNIWHIQHFFCISQYAEYAEYEPCTIACFIAYCAYCFAYCSILFDIFSIFCTFQYAGFETCTAFFSSFWWTYYLTYCSFCFAYICINMQNNMRPPKSICRKVLGSYCALWWYVHSLLCWWTRRSLFCMYMHQYAK